MEMGMPRVSTRRCRFRLASKPLIPADSSTVLTRMHQDYARGGDFAHQEQAQDYQVPVPERSSDHQSIDRLGPSKPYELLTVCSLVKQYPMEVQPQLWRRRRQMTALFLSVLARYPLAVLYTI